ncbi:MAG TPA: transmembrane 220 family protein [Saprospiraceae bacterium]|nr:transmembrane 220 family protein [Saprospiraceae bacterium]HMQ83399.1 transmembrane 220 family protein [Saprospiraceae bacterium]
MAALFLLFAVVQFNDPDPFLWAALYTFVAVQCALAAWGKYYRKVLLGGLLICLIWLATLVPAFINWIKMGMPTIVNSMKAEAPHIELTREFLGLVIGGLTLLFFFKKAPKS